MPKDLSIREEMRLRMDGRLPMEREHPKEGESRFYYNDPRGRKGSFSLLSEMKTVDVPSKDSPNPYLKDIIEDEANRNPENHYIWRTVGDDRVRSTHSDRNGEIFAWDNPPSGGHPGEDYNCRCTAEEYKPGKYKKDATAEIIARNIPRLIGGEDDIKHAYKDTKGFITAGIGKKVDSYEQFRALNWRDKNGHKASESSVYNNYQSIRAAPSGNYSARFYQKYTNIELPSEETKKISEDHLRGDLDFVRTHVPNFDKYPPEIQDAIVDFQYNTGDIRTFPRFLEAVEDKDLERMMAESHRKDISEDRNNDIKNMLMSVSDWRY